MNPEDKKHLQEMTGKFLYYGRAVNDTMLHALNCLSTQINNGTKRTKVALKHFLDYCYDNPDAVKLYFASDMILYIDSDAAYLVEPRAKCRACGFFYLENKDGKLINGSILILVKIIKFVMASAAEAEIAALFMNAKLVVPIQQALIEMGHPQPATKIKTDNSTADGFVNDAIKQNRSKAIDMGFYWWKDRQQQKQFNIYWDNGKINFADYFTKHHHSPSHHKAVRPIYLFDQNNELDMRGCIKILNDRGTPSSKREPRQTVVSNKKDVANASRALTAHLLATLASLIKN